VKVAVAMVTYRRALPYLLTSVASQTRKPEDVVMVLKLWGEGSEEVIKSFSSQLPIKLVVQGRGTSQTQADGNRQRRGRRYTFSRRRRSSREEVGGEIRKSNSLPNFGGICGTTYKAYIKSGKAVKTYEPFYDEKPQKYGSIESHYRTT
jgi:hypothetical protein